MKQFLLFVLWLIVAFAVAVLGFALIAAVLLFALVVLIPVLTILAIWVAWQLSTP